MSRISFDVAELQVRFSDQGFVEESNKLNPEHIRRIHDHIRSFWVKNPEIVEGYDVITMFLLATYHDIGKLADDMFFKGDRINYGIADKHEKRKHCELGYVIAKERSGDLRELTDLIMFHHERWDGKECFFLKGQEIPFFCRLLHIIDAYDVLTHKIVPFEHDDAIKRIKSEAGYAFDPDLVTPVVEALEEPVIDLDCA